MGLAFDYRSGVRAPMGEGLDRRRRGPLPRLSGRTAPVIAVTCRNGEHFSVDPVSIERVETDPDTVIHLVDGTKYVIDQTFDQLMRTIRDHRATVLVAQKRL